jgi:hypothetical protein
MLLKIVARKGQGFESGLLENITSLTLPVQIGTLLPCYTHLVMMESLLL